MDFEIQQLSYCCKKLETLDEMSKRDKQLIMYRIEADDKLQVNIQISEEQKSIQIENFDQK